MLSSGLALAREPVQIPAGNFNMGCSENDERCDGDEGKPGGIAVYVPAFNIDKYEVTVAEYRNCIANGHCTRPLDNNRNQYCNFDHPDREQHPVNCIDWSQAVAYCTTQGGRLPREAEWEKAARADSVTAFPWGDRVSCKEAILDEVSPQQSDQEPDGCWTDATWAVGSRPANGYGLHDMHGNAGEWTATWYTPNAIRELYAKGNLDGPERSRQRVVRGGSWDENRANLRSSYRNTKPPAQDGAIYGSIGFRCAYDI